MTERTDILEEIKGLKAALKACANELFWCAKQAGADWDDPHWRSKSKPGKAYDAARAALKGEKL